MHPRQSGELRIGARQSTQAHQRVGARIAQQADKARQLGRCVAQDHAAARVEHRALRVEQKLHRLLDLPGVPLRHRVVRAQRNRFRVGEFGRRLRHVLRNIDEHGSRSSGRRKIKSFLDRDSEVLHVFDEEVVLDTRPCDADGVAFLERVLADRMRRHLPGDDDQRNRIHIRRRDAGNRVGDARTRRHERDTDLVRRARIAVRSMHGALLVPHQDVLHFVLLEQLVVDVEDSAARIAEDVLDAFFLQAADRDFRTGELHYSKPLNQWTIPAHEGVPAASCARRASANCGDAISVCASVEALIG